MQERDAREERKRLEEYIAEIKKGCTFLAAYAEKLAERFPEYENELKKALRIGEEKELMKRIEEIRRGEASDLSIKKARELVERFPEYGEMFKDALRAYEVKREEKELQDCIERIRRGGTHFIERARELVERFPQYADELEEAVTLGEERELRVLIELLKWGYRFVNREDMVERAREHVEKFPQYRSELERSLRIGKKRERMRKRKTRRRLEPVLLWLPAVYPEDFSERRFRFRGVRRYHFPFLI